MKDNIRPSKGFYFLGAIVIIIGVILFVTQLVSTIKSYSSNSHRLVAPGISEVKLEEAGTYTIFYEYRSSFEGKIYSTYNSDISALGSVLYYKNTEKVIELTEPKMNSTFNFSGREGVSVFEFILDEPATIVIESEYLEGSGPEIVLNISKNMVLGLFAGIGKSLLILFGTTSVGVGIIVITAIKRNKAKKKHLPLNDLIR